MTTLDKDTSSVRGLQSAVNRLNSVMFVCFSCILVQVLLLMLNYALGYSNKTGKSVGPQYFYWYDKLVEYLTRNALTLW